MALEISNELPDNREILLSQLIVQEGIVPSFVLVWQAITKKTVALVQAMMPQLTDLDEKAQISPIKSSKYRDLLKLVKDFSFITYADTLVVVPEGFTGSYVDFLISLQKIGSQLAIRAPKVIEDYALELSMFLSNKDARMSLKNHELFYKGITRERDEYYKTLKSFIDPKAPTRSRARLGEIMGRFQDLEEVFRQAEHLEAVRKDLNYKGLLAGVSKASELLKLIKDRFEQGEIDSVSKEAARNLATGAYEVAEYVELVATYGYLAESALGATNSMTDQLNTLFKRG